MYKVEAFVMHTPLPFTQGVEVETKKEAEIIAQDWYSEPNVQGIRITDQDGKTIFKRGVMQ